MFITTKLKPEIYLKNFVLSYAHKYTNNILFINKYECVCICAYNITVYVYMNLSFTYINHFRFVLK